MPGVRAIQRKLNAYKQSLPAILDQTVDNTKDKYLELNKEQLLEGKNRFGQHLAPTYFNDPYFKSPESAKRYSDWKDRITPNDLRPSGVPNLFITGVYHSTIDITVDPGKITIAASFGAANDIEKKYPGIYGLDSDSKIKYRPFFRPVFFKLSRNTLKGS
jgi:hypothetical protein